MKLIALFFLALSLGASAAVKPPSSSTVNEQREFFDFERDIRFRENTLYAGEKIDLTEDRNLIRMTDEEIAASGFFKLDQPIDHRKYFYMANFRHQNKYWLARIPKTGVMSTIFQFQTVSSLADKGVPQFIIDWLRMGHIQIRFLMKAESPVVLVTQSLDQPIQKITLWDFGYTLIATKSVSQSDQSYDPVGDGRNKGYVNTHNFASTKDFLEDFRAADLNVEQYKLNIARFEGSELLRNFVKLSSDRIENDAYSVYHTTTNSCVTSVMDGIYSVVPNKKVSWYGRFWRNSERLMERMGLKNEDNPRAAVALLQKQNYILSNGRWQNLELEFSNRQPFEISEDL